MTLPASALAHYFNRIGYTGTPGTDPVTLHALHVRQPLTIAFENLDSWLGRPVALTPEAIFDKLVLRGRGGYCFEQNLLFRLVLEHLGFTVRGLSARVLWNLPDDQVLPRTHQLLLVHCAGEDWIADVGFGGLTMTAPLRLGTLQPQATPHETLRLVALPEGGYRLEAKIAQQWRPLYAFSLEAQQTADYEMANWYVSTHPSSRMVLELIAARADHGCRHALLGRRYTQHFPDGRHEQRTIESPTALRHLLETTLQINTHALPELDTRLATLFANTAP